MAVLRAGLAGEQDHFLGADPVGVDIGQQLQAHLVHPAQAEVRRLDPGLLLLSQDDVGRLEEAKGFLYLFVVGFPIHFTSLRIL